jgi:serine/threonine-protein kinase
LQGRSRYGPGDQIAAKYRLVRPLAEGGMGTVWVAHNVDLDVSVAIKLLRAELVATHSERLLHEARLLARLQHPAIVRVHDCGKTELGDPFIVMELLDGESLADTLERRSRLAPIEAVSLLLPVAEALRTAHEAGIVHRDIKPENVFLASVGGRVQPKVLDFGIALADFAGVRRTADGSVLGSPAYMSPEQARGDAEIDAASDVWALSVVIYELVTGFSPFERDNYNATLRAIVDEDAPSLPQKGAGDELLASIVERGLAKEKQRRFGSAHELGVALAQWLWSHGITEDASDVSLRTAWLHRVSDAPPHSLSAVTLSGPPSSAPTVERAALPSLHSTEGLAVSPTPVPPPARHARLRLALGAALAAAVAAGAVVLWPRPPDPRVQAVSASAEHRVPPPLEEKAPPPSEAPRSEPEPAAADAGAEPTPRAVPRARPAEKPRARPSAPRPYRPRGI